MCGGNRTVGLTKRRIKWIDIAKAMAMIRTCF